MSHQDNLALARQYWDNEAQQFDNEPDHGLRDPLVRAAWVDLLRQHLPSVPASILDIGCGTGSLSVLLAELGYVVTGIDLSSGMITQAEKKAQAAGYSIPFAVMDAFALQLPLAQFEVVLCRHLLWLSPDLVMTLQSWAELLGGNGRFLLIEGYWHTGGGLHAPQIVAALPGLFACTVQNLSQTPALWDGAVTDERYMVIAKAQSLSS